MRLTLQYHDVSITPELVMGMAIKHFGNMRCHAGELVDIKLAYLAIYRILYIASENT
jgi:hypothetical protein